MYNVGVNALYARVRGMIALYVRVRDIYNVGVNALRVRDIYDVNLPDKTLVSSESPGFVETDAVLARTVLAFAFRNMLGVADCTAERSAHAPLPDSNNPRDFGAVATGPMQWP